MQLFTLEEAEAVLPRIRDELEAMQACKRTLDRLRADMGQAVERASGNGHVHDRRLLAEGRRQAERLADELNERIARVTAAGVEMKSIDEGLVDFRSQREGRIVYLCWRLGEDRITWWHELDSGFAGRQPL